MPILQSYLCKMCDMEVVVGFALREQLKRESTSIEIETPEEDKALISSVNSKCALRTWSKDFSTGRAGCKYVFLNKALWCLYRRTS